MRAILEGLTARERRAVATLLGASIVLGAGMAGVVVVTNLLLQAEPGPWSVLVGALSLCIVALLTVLNARVIPERTRVVLEVLAERRAAVADRLRATPLAEHQLHPDLAGATAVELDVVEELPYMLVVVGFMLTSLTVSTTYIATISTAGLAVWGGIVGLIVAFHRRAQARMRRLGPEAAALRRRLGAALRLRLDGHAQLQHDARARAETLDELLALEREGAQVLTALHDVQGSSMAWAEDILLIGFSVVLFRLPAWTGIDDPALFALSTTILSVSGLTLALVGFLLRGRMLLGALERLVELEARLGPAPGPPPTEPPLPAGPELVLELSNLVYAYGEAGFRVGPVSLQARGGELIILRGGNGSGKTTLMRVAAGLYPPTEGSIRLGGRRVGPDELAWYQSHVTAIFVDQHLFDAPYGLDAAPEEVQAALERFGLADTVSLEGGRFSRTALSSGQRKRLAMVVALLERRPILIFDEWDSHQDPGLRAFYYETLLPELQARGHIVIVVSHDARRFGLADRLLHLQGGQPVEDEGA